MGPLVTNGYKWLQTNHKPAFRCRPKPRLSIKGCTQQWEFIMVTDSRLLTSIFLTPPPYTLPMQSMVQLLDWTGIFRDHILYPCNLVTTLSIKGCTQHWEFIPVTDSRLLTSIFLTLLLSSLPPLQFWNHFETWTTISTYISLTFWNQLNVVKWWHTEREVVKW